MTTCGLPAVREPYSRFDFLRTSAEAFCGGTGVASMTGGLSFAPLLQRDVCVS